MPYSQRWRLRWFDETTNVLRSESLGLQCSGVGDPWQEKWAQKRETSFYPLPPCFCLVFLHHLSPFCQRGSHQLPLLFISFCVLWVTFPCVHQHASTICHPHVYLVLCLENLCYVDAFQVQLRCHCFPLWYLHVSYLLEVLIHCVCLQNTCISLRLHYFTISMFGSRQGNTIYVFISAP